MKKMKYGNYDCVVVKTNYVDNNNLALVLLEENNQQGAPVAIATVNTDSVLPRDEAYVKSYSENEGMLEALMEAGLVEEVLGEKRLGYVTVKRVKFNLEDVEELEV